MLRKPEIPPTLVSAELFPGKGKGSLHPWRKLFAEPFLGLPCEIPCKRNGHLSRPWQVRFGVTEHRARGKRRTLSQPFPDPCETRVTPSRRESAPFSKFQRSSSRQAPPVGSPVRSRASPFHPRWVLPSTLNFSKRKNRENKEVCRRRRRRSARNVFFWRFVCRANARQRERAKTSRLTRKLQKIGRTGRGGGQQEVHKYSAEIGR